MRTSSRSPWLKRSASGHRPISRQPKSGRVEVLESFPPPRASTSLLLGPDVTSTVHQRGADAATISDTQDSGGTGAYAWP